MIHITRVLALSIALFLLGCVGCAGQQEQPQPAEPTQSAAHLLPQVTLQNPHLREVVVDIQRHGNESDHFEASSRLVQLANMVASTAWRDAQRPAVQRMTGNQLTQATMRARLDAWQQRYQAHVYKAVAVLPSSTLQTHCKAVIMDGKRSTYEQQLARSAMAAQAKGSP